MKMQDSELKELVDLYQTAQNTPVIAISVRDGIDGNDFASRAYKRFQERWADICFKYKISPDENGFNSETGEFVKE